MDIENRPYYFFMYYLFDSMSNNDQLPSYFEYFLPTKLFAQAWFHLLKAKLYKSISITNFFSLYQKLRDMPIYPTQIENVRGIFEKKVFFGKSFFPFFQGSFFSILLLLFLTFLKIVFQKLLFCSTNSFSYLSFCIFICLSICPSTNPSVPPSIH